MIIPRHSANRVYSDVPLVVIIYLVLHVREIEFHLIAIALMGILMIIFQRSAKLVFLNAQLALTRTLVLFAKVIELNRQVVVAPSDIMMIIFPKIASNAHLSVYLVFPQQIALRAEEIE